MKFALCLASLTVLGAVWMLRPAASPQGAGDSSELAAIEQRLRELSEDVERLERGGRSARATELPEPVQLAAPAPAASASELPAPSATDATPSRAEAVQAA